MIRYTKPEDRMKPVSAYPKVIPAGQAVELTNDPRYSVKPELQIFADGHKKLVYRAFYRGLAMGEIQNSTHREAVLEEMEAFRNDGGFTR